MTTDNDWRVEEEDADYVQIDEYDLTSTPNDFNTSTIFNFIESGAVKIPGFQRYYVWDLKRASKLIESLIIGLPVPQVFLYEQSRNSFLVIDGQQRLMTIYYFIKRRFPKKRQRAYIKGIFESQGGVPDALLHDDEYFEDFNLRLPETGSGRPNKFNKLNYSTLGEHKVQFDLRTIRNVVVKQVKPSDDESSIFEIFNRLNTGGMSLTPQEIRLSMFHSTFYDLLLRTNMDDRWRRTLGQPEPDLHMRDVEILLRGIALWKHGTNYRPSMVRFLNGFSRVAQEYSAQDLADISDRLDWFLNANVDVDPDAYLRGSKFSQPVFESIFAAAALLRDDGRDFTLTTKMVNDIESDSDFARFSTQKTTDTTNVLGRRSRARELMEHEEASARV